jgi:hypothetical protein
VSLLKRENGSERKVAANRRNALKSTARLREGKRRARVNAWKDARYVRTSAEDLLKRWLRGRAHGGGDQKKECLILTNKANMLLKTKDRENERSQTKPILSVGKPPAVAAGCACPRVPGTAVFVLVGERSALPMAREPGRLPYPNKSADLKVGATPQPLRTTRRRDGSRAVSPDFSPRVWKGGALAPPLQGLSDYSRAPCPAQLAAASCAGRGTNSGREPRFRRG